MKLTKINPATIKPGDEVEDITIGKGVVKEIDQTAYPIKVEFDSITVPVRYTIKGFLQQSDVRASIYLKIEDDENTN